MGSIYYLMGKSSSGKDTLYRRLLGEASLKLKRIVPYTTRPMREGETEGIEYFFCKENRLQELERAGKVVELRAYHTVYGIWKYFTVDDGQIDFNGNDYLMIGTLESYEHVREYFGKEKVIPIYIEVEDGERLRRALEREGREQKPKYEEMCRRFLADAADFSEEKIAAAGITRRFINDDLARVQKEIREYVLEGRGQSGY